MEHLHIRTSTLFFDALEGFEDVGGAEVARLSG